MRKTILKLAFLSSIICYFDVFDICEFLFFNVIKDQHWNGSCDEMVTTTFKKWEKQHMMISQVVGIQMMIIIIRKDNHHIIYNMFGEWLILWYIKNMIWFENEKE